jgi:hypothetical protein
LGSGNDGLLTVTIAADHRKAGGQMADHRDDEGSWDFGEPEAPAGNPARPPRVSHDPKRSNTVPVTAWTAGPGEGSAVTGRGVHEPLQLLIAAAACTIGSILLGLLSWKPELAILGWFLGGLAAIGFVTAFTLLDTKRRADPYYLARPTGRVLCRIVISAAVLGTALNAWHFADYMSRVRVL